MELSFRPNRFDIFAVVALIVTTMLFLRTALNAALAYAGLRPLSDWDQTIGCFGWLLATLGPLMTCVVFWRWSKRLRRAWIPHLLILPLALAALSGGESLMLLALKQSDFDATIGGPVIQAELLFILVVVGYFIAVFHRVFMPQRNRTNGG